MESAPDEMNSHYPIERDTGAAQMGCRIQECGPQVMSL
jgi:hypothetical protein